MKKNVKRIIALFMLVVLMLSAVPTAAFAAETEAGTDTAIDAVSEQEEPSPGTEIDAYRIWPAMRRAAAAASVGASSVLKIGSMCFSEEVGTLPTLGVEIYHLPAKTLLTGGKHIAAYCLDEHLGATDGMDYTWSSLSKSNQEVIGTILALGFQWNSSSMWSGPSDNGDKWAVTQILIWEAMANNIILQANGLFGVKSGSMLI